MMKRYGIAVGMDAGGPRLHVTRPSSTEDAVWKAVEEAIIAGWTPKRFLAEVRQAWEEEVDRQARYDKKEAKRVLKHTR